jgi:hypothetical protein
MWDTEPSFPLAQPGPVTRDPAQRCPDKPDIPRARVHTVTSEGSSGTVFQFFFLPLHIPTDLVVTRFACPAVRVQVEPPRAQRFGRDLLKTYPRPTTNAEVPGQARHPPQQGSYSALRGFFRGCRRFLFSAFRGLHRDFRGLCFSTFRGLFGLFIATVFPFFSPPSYTHRPCCNSFCVPGGPGASGAPPRTTIWAGFTKNLPAA